MVFAGVIFASAVLFNAAPARAATPVAHLQLNPFIMGSGCFVETGETATFDASSSTSALDDPINKYEWDFNGDGTFDRTTTVPTTTTSFDRQMDAVPAVRVTTESASSNTAGYADGLHVFLSSEPGPAGVSINQGAQFTNDPNVTVSARWDTRFNRYVFASNDGGFNNAQTLDIGPTFNWTLDSSGPERLPKTIYVRFLFQKDFFDGSSTFQDDIILDETPPVVSTASVTDSGTPALAPLIASASSRMKSKIKLKASDKTSGVAFVQTAVKKSRPAAKRKFANVFTVSGPKPKYIRARDYAGNNSKWKKLKKGK